MMFLSTMGWVNGSPPGNRLRWTYPFSKQVNDSFLALPNRIVIDRAPVGDHHFDSQTNGPYAPDDWWDPISLTLPTGGFPQELALDSPVQLLRFTFRGPSSRVLILSLVGPDTVFDQIVHDGETVVTAAATISRIWVYAANAQLLDIESVDLFKDRDLEWKELATIDVSGTVDDTDLSVVAARHGGSLQLSNSDWQELVQQAKDSVESTPADILNSDMSAWQAFELMLGLSWEPAVLFGFGFVDGPKSELSKLDTTNKELLLENPLGSTLAYRVRDSDDKVKPSNIALCFPQVAAELSIPEVPSIQLSTVSLSEQGNFIAALEMSSSSPEASVLSHQFEQKILVSPLLGGSESIEQFMVSTDSPAQIPARSETRRSVPVVYHDVLISCRARACDGWDRFSAPSSWSTPQALELLHEPLPPMLSECRFNGSALELEWKTNEAGNVDWSPDVVLSQAGATLIVYTQMSEPRRATGSASEPMLVENQRDQYRVSVASIPNLQDFVSGHLLSQGNRYVIDSVSGSRVFFQLSNGNSAQSMFPAGQITLQQNPMHIALWTEIATLDALALNLIDTLSSPSLPDKLVHSFHVRLHYLGRIGPESNIVQAIRRVPVPNTQPPFDIESLGIDFYNRTLVKVTFLSPLSTGLYRVWWADGVHTAATFERSAIEGDWGSQTLIDSRFLFDTLSLPIPVNRERSVTIGVQCVNEMGGQSRISTVTTVVLVLSVED